MPSIRWQNWALIKANYEEINRVASGFGMLIWQPIVYVDEYQKIPVEALGLLANTQWIRLLVIARETHAGGLNQCIHKNNTGLQAIKHIDAHVLMSSDDNLLPIDYVKVMAQRGGGKKVIVCSHKRGQRTTFHGHSDLTAEPVKMFPSYVSGEQYIIHNSIMPPGYDANKGLAADGVLIHELYKQRPDDFKFLPNYFIPFNALEKGRWDREKLIACIRSESLVSRIPNEIFT